MQIGFSRDVPQTSTAAATQQVLKWQPTASGSQIAAINFTSTGAKGMRLGLLVNQLPDTATLRFYAKGATTAFEISGAEVWKVLAANLVSGDKSEAGRTYWGPMTDSADAMIEIEVPRGSSTSAVNVSVPSISHIFMSAKEISAAAQTTYSGDVNLGLTCQVDVTCTTPLPAASDAVAYLVFSDATGSYSCSGTLLNDSISSGTPYLLTANHCISTQSAASTLITRFQYRSITCNDAVNGTYFQTATAGSKLLYSAYATDSTLVQLYGTVNSPTPLYAGWDTTTAPTTATTGIHSIHHPKGDQQRLSRGSMVSYYTRSATNPNGFIGSNVTSGTILNVKITTGLTEQGSSGSGLFKGTDANPQVIGQLFGGTEPACTVTGGTVAVQADNVYGRFDVAFNAGMKDWLVKGRKPVYRFYNTGNGSHFYSVSETEKNYVRASIASYFYEGPAFNADNVSSTTTSPVYRFYNATTRAHFYTINETEKANVIATLPQYAYEGISWYAKTPAQILATPDATMVPLFRFYNLSNGTHFYTNSATERDNVKAKLSNIYYYEGIAYYVWP
jgi:lysyl endopeptidase